MPDYDTAQFDPGPYNGMETQKEVGLMGNLRRPTVMKQVEMQMAQHKERLAQLEKVHEILTKNPEIHDLLTLMRKVGI